VSQRTEKQGHRAAQQVREKFQQVPDLFRQLPDLFRPTVVPKSIAPSFTNIYLSLVSQNSATRHFSAVSVQTKVNFKTIFLNSCKFRMKKCIFPLHSVEKSEKRGVFLRVSALFRVSRFFSKSRQRRCFFSKKTEKRRKRRSNGGYRAWLSPFDRPILSPGDTAAAGGGIALSGGVHRQGWSMPSADKPGPPPAVKPRLSPLSQGDTQKA